MLTALLAQAFLYLLTFVKIGLNKLNFLYFLMQIIRIPSSLIQELHSILSLEINRYEIHRKYYRQKS